jgi:Asp-tRNA(Asn)/Glu-tRNA(Gln) amidotransferase C subunit
MSSLSRDEVAKLAGLARIEMTESELVELSSQFGMILDAVARVQEIDLSGESDISPSTARECGSSRHSSAQPFS